MTTITKPIILDETGQRIADALESMNPAEAEAWAVGERNGVPVTSGDETYHNNSKYWAGKSSDSAAAAAASAEEAGEAAGERLQEAFATDTASGAVAYFSDGANGIYMKSVKAAINLSQNFNGYNAPWSAGAGKNQLDFDNATLIRGTVSGMADNFTFTVTASRSSGIFFPLPDSFAGKTMYLSGSIVRTGTHANDIAIQLQYTRNGTDVYSTKVNYVNNTATLEDTSINIAADGTNFFLRIIASADNDDSTGETMTVTNLCLCDEAGQTWSPYANICPITGYTSAMVIKNSANFLRPNPWANGGTIGAFVDGEYTFTINQDGNTYISWSLPNNLAGKTIYLSGIVRRTGTHTNNYAARIARRVNGGAIGYQSFAQYSDNEVVYEDNSLTIPEGATTISLQVIASASNDFSIGETMTVKDLRLCLAAGQPFTEYQRSSYTVSFDQTIYGGTVDFVSGVLTIDKGVVTIDGDSIVGTIETIGSLTRFWVNVGAIDKKYVSGGAICDSLPSIRSYSAEEVGIGNGMSDFPTRFWIKLPTAIVGSTEVSITAYLAAHPMTVAYDLANPISVQLTPQEIASFYSVNNIWANTGDINVVYHADPGLYITKKFSAVIPPAPTTDGTYVLTVTITDGVPVYSWASNE